MYDYIEEIRAFIVENFPGNTYVKYEGIHYNKGSTYYLVQLSLSGKLFVTSLKEEPGLEEKLQNFVKESVRELVANYYN